jgi:hypothetical protein
VPRSRRPRSDTSCHNFQHAVPGSRPSDAGLRAGLRPSYTKKILL